MGSGIAVLALAWVVNAQPPPGRAGDPPASWKGELVTGKKPVAEIGFGDTLDGARVEFKFRDGYPLRVRDDRGGRLRVFDGHNEGWVCKGDFVLSRDALAYFTLWLLVDPSDTWSRTARGIAWHELGAHDAAIADFDEVMRREPSATMFINRGVVWLAKTRYDMAALDFDAAIRLDPADGDGFFYRGRLAHREKQYGRAIEDYDEALRLAPADLAAFTRRGLAWCALKQYDKALRDLETALRLDPKCGFAQAARAFTRAKMGRHAEAVKDYEQALKIDPEEGWMWRDYALFRASCPDAAFRDGKRALELAAKAIELAGVDADWEYHSTLAATHAEAGAFDKAVAAQEKALADTSLDAIDRGKMEARLKLYRAKKPYRDE